MTRAWLLKVLDMVARMELCAAEYPDNPDFRFAYISGLDEPLKSAVGEYVRLRADREREAKQQEAA